MDSLLVWIVLRRLDMSDTQGRILSRARDFPNFHPARAVFNIALRGSRLPVRRSSVQALRNTRLARRLRMDGQTQSISSQQLYQHLGTASAPILVDVRRQDAFGKDDRLIIGALRRPPEE